MGHPRRSGRSRTARTKRVDLVQRELRKRDDAERTMRMKRAQEAAERKAPGLFESTTDERKSKRWRVRQWTDFPWSNTDENARRDREENLERFARALEIVLRNKCAQFEPMVRQVRVDRRPQLIFEMTLGAAHREEAVTRLMYWVQRASSTTRTVRRGGRTHQSPVGLTFPFGRVEVEKV